MKRDPLFVEVANELTNLILSDYPPGSKIPTEPQLSEMFEVSRTTIRAAVGSLVSKRILEIRRGDGTYVTQNPGLVEDALGIQFMNAQSVAKDIGETSLIFQPHAAALSAMRRTDKDIEEMQLAINELEEGWVLYKKCIIDYHEIRLRDTLFHASVINSSHNQIMTRINSLFQEYGRKTKENRSDQILESSLKMHPEILDAIKKKDAETAKNLMLKHLEEINEILSTKE